MIVPCRALNGCHKSTEMCRGGAEKKRRRLAEAEVRDSAEMAFEVYGEQLQTVSRFKYLGRILTEGDDDWPEVAGNLEKARKSWGRLQGILSREGATKRVSGKFFKALVQQVLLFGAETWVVSLMMERALSAFIHGAARWITVRQPRKGRDGKWYYPSLEGATKEAGLTDVPTSINRRQNTVAQYIATRQLLDLCKGAKQREGARVTIRWLDQSGIDWEKAKAKETEMESASNSGSDTEGGRRGKHKAGQASQVGRNGAERVRTNGYEGNLDNILHRTDSSDWVSAVLGLEKPPNNEHANWSR